jgi:aryl-alcohol dehydrogenase-like predicted oxidoreductase
MIDRRKFFGLAATAGASLAVTPTLLRALSRSGRLAHQAGSLIQRAIPSSGELLPAVGLSFSNHPSCADRAVLTEVVKSFAAQGGKLFDAMHSNAANEQFHISAAAELGVTDKFFWSFRAVPSGAPPTGSPYVSARVDSLLSQLRLPKLDLGLLPVNFTTTELPALKEEKRNGRVRYIGVQTIVVQNQAAQLEALMRNEPLDFIGVDFDIGNRFVEERILPLALERKIGVIAYFPFGNNGGVSCGSGLNLFARVGTRPLPEWAAEFDATSWAQFFSKYVLSHPAITVARVGTSKPHHMIDNIAGGSGRLPNEATRRRMAALIDSFPAPVREIPESQRPGIAVPAATLDRYVGEYKAVTGTFVATFRRDGARFFVKPGNSPEMPLNARTETRFQDPRGPIFEFVLDAQGNVTGAVLEQQGPQGTTKLQLERK